MFVSMLIALNTVTGLSESRQSVPLTEILEKAGDRVQQYTTTVLSVACTELTRQLELEPDLTTVKKKPIELVYDFIIIPGIGFGILEQRELKLIDGKPAAKNAQPSIPVTTAFTTAVTVLLREIRDNFAFSSAGTADLDGREALLIDYLPAIRRPPSATWEGARFRLNFESKGRIWIDPISYDVLRIETHLIEPVEFQPPRVMRKGPFVLFGPAHKFKVKVWDVAIRFAPTSFKEPEQTLMLPVSAESFRIIEGMRVPRLRITHSFTNYRRFSSDVKIGQ
jgi:hypothetical protein